jgi:hypothetical protein
MGRRAEAGFIEFRLFWDGHVNRSDIIKTFGVSVNQASTDLNRYFGLAPDNMAYDKSARTYVRTSRFSPLFLKPGASQFLTQVRLVAGYRGQGRCLDWEYPSFRCDADACKRHRSSYPALNRRFDRPQGSDRSAVSIHVIA